MQAQTRPSISNLGIVVIFAAIGSGCTQEAAPPKATHTVDEYLAKPKVMEAKLRECANNPGELRNTPDCINVKAAAQQNGIGSRKKMEPLKFPSAEDMNASNGAEERR